VSFPTEAAVPSAVGAAATGDAGGPAEAAPAETAVELEGATAVTPSPDAESVAVPAKVAALAAAPPAPPLPLTPRGLVKRVRRRLRPLRRWVRHHPALRKVRGALALEQHLAFAVACARDEPVRKLAARADIIVGLDTGSYQTLWVLARLVRTPHAVVGLAAARRILKEGS
jgi:hypothetical protein